MSLFLHHTESVTCSKNTVTCTNRVTPRSVFQTPHTLQVKNARCKSWGAAHERTNAVSSVFFFFCLLARPQPRAWTWDNEANSSANDMALCSFFFFTCSIPGCVRNMRRQSTCTYAMPWCVPRGAILIECSEQHAVSMPSLGVNVVPIRTPILMLAQTRKIKKETSRRTDSAQSHMQQFCVTARVQPLVRWHGHSLVSTHSIGKNLDYDLAAVCGSMHASSHLCVGMGVRLCKIRRRTHLSPNSIL